MNLRELRDMLEDHLTDLDIQDAQELLNETNQKMADLEGNLDDAQAESARLRTQAVADAVRIAELERAQTWLPIDESTPYEKKILTKWVGDEHRPPVVLVNTRNNSVGIGRKDGFWFSLPDQTPTLWCNLPESAK